MGPFHKPHPPLLCPTVRNSAVTVWNVLGAKKQTKTCKDLLFLITGDMIRLCELYTIKVITSTLNSLMDSILIKFGPYWLGLVVKTHTIPQQHVHSALG